MIKETKVISIKQRLLCDDCDCEMESTGQAYMSNLPQYPHKCPKCGKINCTNVLYPTIIQRRINLIYHKYER